MSRLLIIDGNNSLYRSFHGTPEMHRADGLQTNGLFGFINSFIKATDLLKPTHRVVIFDNATGHKTWRKKLDPEYKANRNKQPTALTPQFAMAREACDAFGIVRDERKTYEADDLIASYVNTFSKVKGLDIVIMTSDKDMHQLVSANVSVFDPLKKRSFTPVDVFEHWGVEPQLLPILQAFTGDAIDNIKGVTGIGPKTAVKLISEHGADYQAMVASVKSSSQKKKLKDGATDFTNALKLVTLVDNLKIKHSLTNLRMLEPDKAELKKFLTSMQFSSIIERLKLNERKLQSLFI